METECPGCDDLLREVDRLRARLRCDPEPHHWVSSNVPGSDLVPWVIQCSLCGVFNGPEMDYHVRQRGEGARPAATPTELQDPVGVEVPAEGCEHMSSSGGMGDRLRARLAEVEAEQVQREHQWIRDWDEQHARACAAESHLAAVLALCDDFAGDIEHSRVHGDGPAEYREGWQHGVEFAAGQVRAAAAGDDRG